MVDCLVDTSQQIEDSVMRFETKHLCYIKIANIYEKIVQEFTKLKDEKLLINTSIENLSEYIYSFIDNALKQIFNPNSNQYIWNDNFQSEFAEFYRLDDMLEKLQLKRIAK